MKSNHWIQLFVQTLNFVFYKDKILMVNIVGIYVISEFLKYQSVKLERSNVVKKYRFYHSSFNSKKALHVTEEDEHYTGGGIFA